MNTSKSRANKKSGLSFQLSLSGFLFLAVLVVIGMAWSFILGVIVGRGHQPEQVARSMIKKVVSEEFPLLTDKNEEVLKGEELEFFDKLKQGPSTTPEAKPAPAKTPPAEAKPAAKSETKTAPTAAPSTDKEEIFVFNYQIAALASMEQAQTFLKKLTPGGFKTSVVTATHEGKTWYRVYVHHQGSVPSALALREELKKYGVNDALLRSRTPL